MNGSNRQVPPQGSGAWPPYGQPGPYPPQGSGQYPPQGSGQYPPQGSGQYPPQGSGQYPPQGSGQYPPQGSGQYPPQGSGQYPPQGNSAALNDHNGDFWRDPPKPKKKRNYALWGAIAALLLVLACALLFFGIFRVRHIDVIGNDQVPVQTVIAQSGIRMGASTLFLNEQEIAERINKHRYLRFSSLTVRLDTVTLQVTERHAEAVLKYSGYYYTIDRSGMVLEVTADAAQAPDLVEISGIEVSGRSGVRVGSVISAADKEQLSVMSELLLYLKVLSMQKQVRAVKLSDMNSILMVTEDGCTVAFGNGTRILAKLKALRAVCENLKERGAGTGTIDITAPETPTFIPDH